MRSSIVALLVLGALAAAATSGAAQAKERTSGGEVSLDRLTRVEASRLSRQIPGVDSEQAAFVRVGGDSAQRIALADYGWRGRVMSVEFDAADGRVFWDVKIVPDSSARTVVRYRVDATGAASWTSANSAACAA